MKDVKIFSSTLGCLSLLDSEQDILNKFSDNKDITIETEGSLTIIKDNTKDSTDNAVLAFVSDESGVKLIDMCASTTDEVHIGDKHYTFEEFKEKFNSRKSSLAMCEHKNEEINPYDVHKECNTICANNDLECYLNCPMCGELKHRIRFEEYNTVITYWDSLDNTLVYIERIR